MGPTLFGYIFRDLVRVFLLSAVVIAGIMSFGGLLRPLREHGLEIEQALVVLVWLLPAMMTYSLPVAALFATTFVYGRLAADNETTAIRASGVPTGLTGIAFPAVFLGVIASGVSLLLLCFVVPAANLQVERTIYSNLARIVANEVNRTKRAALRGVGGRITVTADSASVLDASQLARIAGWGALPPETQVVQLRNVYLIRYGNYGTASEPYEVPDEVYTARRATAFIEPPAYLTGGLASASIFRGGLDELQDDRFLLTVTLEEGVKFPRAFEAAEETPLVGAVHATQFGPLAMASPVRENTKFLDIRELRRLYLRPELGRRVAADLRSLVEHDQRRLFLTRLHRQAAEGGIRLEADTGQFLLITREATPRDTPRGMNLTSPLEDGIELVQRRGGEILTVTARRMHVRADPVQTSYGPTVLVNMSFPDATVSIRAAGTPAEAAEVTTNRAFDRRLAVPMPEEIAAMSQIGPREYLELAALDEYDAAALRGTLLRQQNAVASEIWARGAFAVACLILPAIGAALGMLFRSGAFLTAFGISVIPAMFSIVLIVVGQQVAKSVPSRVGPETADPLVAGVTLIWSGNALVALVAILLLWRLGRS